MDEPETLLGDIRVLDLTDQKGVYCTKLLADLGADTIKIEKPGGDPMRRVGPFFHDESDPEKSLYWFHFNTSKRGITLNLETADGREILKRLAGSADVVVETFPPGHLAEIGLGYSVLRQLNPRLVLTSITPFGLTGPHRDFKGSDLIAQAMGGLMYLAGFPEDPPHKLHGSPGLSLRLRPSRGGYHGSPLRQGVDRDRAARGRLSAGVRADGPGNSNAVLRPEKRDHQKERH